MTSTGGPLWSPGKRTANPNQPSETQTPPHAACENCYLRKQKCIGDSGMYSMKAYVSQTSSSTFTGACQACMGLGIECKPRSRSKVGRPRGARQSSWRADLRPLKQHSDWNIESQSGHVVTDSSRLEVSIPPTGTSCSLETFSTAVETDFVNIYEGHTPSTIDWSETWLNDTLLDGVADHDVISTPELNTDDIKLHNIHGKIRSLSEGRAYGEARTASKGIDIDNSLLALEELSQLLHLLAQDRNLQLFAIAVLWNAVELGQSLAMDLTTRLSLSDSSFVPPNGRSHPPASAHATEFMPPRHSPTRPMSSSSWNSRRSAITVWLTRLGVCLNEYAAFTQKCEDWSGTPTNDGISQRPMLDCRLRITSLLERITPYIHMVTCSWSMWGQQ